MSGSQSPPKRPRLSLQIKAISSGPSVRTSRTLAAVVDPTSPTAFNTLSNVYSTAVDRSTPLQAEPVTAINTRGQPPLPRLKTQDGLGQARDRTPYTAHYPDTPLTAQPISPAVAMEISFPSTMTATPPLSAGPVDSTAGSAFSFTPRDLTRLNPDTALSPLPPTPRRRTTAPTWQSPPYNHPRSLHSILRNSPLPPRTALSPVSPRRQSLRLQEKAARRVGYNSPLTQTITTNKYTKSHADLLFEEASPYSPHNPQEDPEMVLDLAMAYTGDETRDGGQTPGPFEEMRRRMAGLATSTPTSAGSAPASAGGIRKRKRKDKKRRWVWTIGQEDDDGEVGGALAAIRAAQGPAPVSVPVIAPPLPPPMAGKLPKLAVDVRIAVADAPPPEIITPSIERPDEDFCQGPAVDASGDIEMSDSPSQASDTTSRGLTPADADIDMITPIATRKGSHDAERQRRAASSRLGSEDLVNPATGMRRDTPIPADLLPVRAVSRS